MYLVWHGTTSRPGCLSDDAEEVIWAGMPTLSIGDDQCHLLLYGALRTNRESYRIY